MSEWKETTLQAITTKIGSGATPRGGSNAYKNEGISLIRSQNILDLQFSTDGLAFIDDEQADGLKNVVVESNDVLLNITGDSVARVCKVPDYILPARVNQHVAIIRADKSCTTPGYILYNLISQKEELLSQSEIGATRKAITKGMIEKFELILPPLPEQRAIASVLSSLDDKIDLLHRQNQTLEHMAEALFRQWFVEDPNPDWEEKPLSDFGQIICGKTPSKKKLEYFDGEYPFIKIPDMHGKTFVFDTQDSLTEEGFLSQKKKALPTKSINVSCIATVGLVTMNAFPSQTNQQINSIIPEEKYRYYLYCEMKNAYDLLHSMASGGTATLNLNTGNFSKIPVLKPDEDSIERFNHVVIPMFDKIFKNQTQIRTLTTLRDTLLPKLMSGEVRVADTPVIALKKTKEARPEFKEAILLAAIVRTLFTPKIGNVSRQWYQKVAYLHKRKLKELNEPQSVFQLTMEYSKKAAGPYKKNMRYQGPEGICLKNRYLEAVNDYAFKPSEDIDKIDTYFDNYWNRELFENWTMEKFRFVPVKKLGVYATVDYSLLEMKEEGKELSASNVLGNISESKDWKHKKDLPEFSPQSIEQAIDDLKNLYTY